MKVLFLGKATSKTGLKALCEIETVLPEIQVELYQSVPSISDRLNQINLKPAAAVLLSESKTELQEIVTISKYFASIPIILILPANDPETVALGHKIYPRYVTYVNSVFGGIGNVLRNIIDREVQR